MQEESQNDLFNDHPHIFIIGVSKETHHYDTSFVIFFIALPLSDRFKFSLHVIANLIFCHINFTLIFRLRSLSTE